MRSRSGKLTEDRVDDLQDELDDNPDLVSILQQ